MLELLTEPLTRPLWLWLVFSLLGPFSIGISVGTFRTWKRRAEWAHDTATVALEQLELMERAHDPGRDAHYRLAAALEAEIVVNNGPKVEPEERRALAALVASRMLDTFRRAGLVIETQEES
jgi:hypothetical protein